MASGNAHHATGWAAGVVAAVVVARAGAAGPAYLGAVAALACGVAGGSAPDWLEVAWWTRSRRRWIAHRSLTHWGIGWIVLLAWSYCRLGHRPLAAPLFGFALGGLVHLLADWPNPLGVPWIAGRHSLNWWNSGRCDLLIVGASWLAAWFVVVHGMPHGLREWLPRASP
ncbi:hypothetical protein CY652_01175 [Burkholderia sp. WAC0059]|uniref:metal-dependent hydrolase n=1 Tax=Burkholderia sp. WAC0059 TaxID=2066022 RepID=UPI000C7ECA3C|nr:metal-dependent hydrolase [Burkholderia sp. WAC0059]PLZ04315.1 hypothetical protein CY652_01175 [Burkholderia sp. WAC0059]